MEAELLDSPHEACEDFFVARRQQNHAVQIQWSYDEAFRRNRGLFSSAEQETLRNSRVAIAGMGGVGGIHLVTLARLGVGKFSIADPDDFEVANFNRQYGGTLANLGRNKAEVMAEAALEINPELDLRVLREPVNASNVDQFLDDAGVFLDGLDFFAIDARRLLFRRAAERQMWAVTAGPIGHSVAWLTFDPNGMRFDDYFDVRDDMEPTAKAVAFGVGLAPRATHRHYIDFAEVDLARQRGPSVSLACQLASGVAAAESFKILLGRGPIRPAPCYAQFDAYTQQSKQGRLPFGNRGIVQKVKRLWLTKYLTAMASS